MEKDALLTVKKLIAMTPDLAERISTYRHAGRFKTEAEAVRSLIELGLEASEPKAGRRRATKTSDA